MSNQKLTIKEAVNKIYYYKWPEPSNFINKKYALQIISLIMSEFNLEDQLKINQEIEKLFSNPPIVDKTQLNSFKNDIEKQISEYSCETIGLSISFIQKLINTIETLKIKEINAAISTIYSYLFGLQTKDGMTFHIKTQIEKVFSNFSPEETEQIIKTLETNYPELPKIR